MGKPPVSAETPPASLLSSFAGMLESGVLSVFTSAAVDKDAPTESRVNSSQDHDGDFGDHPSKSTASVQKAPRRGLTRLPSESGSDGESDMPGLERLERGTCPVSSEDEASVISSEKGDAAVVVRIPSPAKRPSADGSSVADDHKSSPGMIAARSKCIAQRIYQSSSCALRSSDASGTTCVGGTATGTSCRWARQGISTSSASTLVPGMSPAADVRTTSVEYDSRAQRQVRPPHDEGEVKTPGAVERPGGLVPKMRGQGESAWGYGAGGGGGEKRHASVGGGNGRGLQGSIAVDFARPRVAVAVAVSPSKGDDSSGEERERPLASEGRQLPAPLDMSAVSGPVRPRKKETPPVSSKPVVLQGAALESLKRLGRPGSSVSSMASVGSVSSSALRRRALGPGYKSASGGSSISGVASAGVGRSSNGVGGRSGSGSRAWASSETGTGGANRVVAAAAAAAAAVAAAAPTATASRSFHEEVEESSDDGPPPPSPMLTGHLRAQNINNLKPTEHQQGRGRAAFIGRGPRPPTWTEDDDERVPPSRLPAAESPAAGVCEMKLRLVRPPQLAGGGGRTDEVSPMGTPISITSVSTDARGGGGQASDTYRNSLARVAADFANRGASGDWELLPGLGRSAFEHISFSPTIPLRASCENLIPLPPARFTGSGGGSGGGSGSDGGITGAAFALDAKKRSFDFSKKLSSGDKGAKPHVLSAPRGRSGNFEESGSVASTTKSVLSLDAPSLTLAHAPGRIYRPAQAHHLHQAPARGTPADAGHGLRANNRAAPLRLSSSKRLMSFESRKSSGSPVRWEPPRAAAMDNREGTAGMPRRPTTLDLLSTFGSHHSLSREEDPAPKSASAASVYASAPMKSHAEEDDKDDGDSAGKELGGGEALGKDSCVRSGSTGPRRRSASRRDRISQRRSRSSGSNGGETRRFSTGNSLNDTHGGAGVGRVRSISRSRSGGSALSEDGGDSRRPSDARGRRRTEANSPGIPALALDRLDSGEHSSGRHHHHRRRSERRDRSGERSSRSGHSRRHSGSGGKLTADDHPDGTRASSRGRSTPRRRGDRGHHRRRSSGLPGGALVGGASEANGDGVGCARGHRRLDSAGSRARDVGSPGSRREERRNSVGSSAREKDGGGVGVKNKQRFSLRHSSSPERAGGADELAASGEEGETSGDDGVAVGASLEVEVENRGANVAVASRAPVSGLTSEEAAPLGQRRASKQNKKASASPGHGSPTIRRTPMVKKKGRVKGFLRFTSLFRGHREGSESLAHPAANADADLYTTPPAMSEGASRRQPRVVSTPLRSGRSSARFQRAISRTDSFGDPASPIPSPTGRVPPPPAFSGWLLRIFARRPRSKGHKHPAGGAPLGGPKGAGSGSGGAFSSAWNDGGRGVADAADGQHKLQPREYESVPAPSQPFPSALSRRSMSRKKTPIPPAEERACSGPVGGCLSQFYGEPTSPVLPGRDERGLGGSAPAGHRGNVDDAPEGGARVQHLLRTSQLHMKRGGSWMFSRSDSS